MVSLEGWLFLLAFGAVGYKYLSPLLASIIAKVYPSASGTVGAILSAVAAAGGVVAAIYIGREFFGKRVKGV